MIEHEYQDGKIKYTYRHPNPSKFLCYDCLRNRDRGVVAKEGMHQEKPLARLSPLGSKMK